MTKLKTAQKPKLDIQPNDITEAKYEFSALQKNIIYEVIGELQHLMTKDMLEIGDLSIEDLNISVSVSKLAGSNNHRKVIDQAKELMRKIFEYDYNKDDKKHLKVTTLFHAIDHQYYSDTVKLQISPGAVPVLLYIGNGFTQYQKTIAITLKSVHSKRLYELCCQWKDKKSFNWTIERFKSIMGLKGKYKSIKDLKRNVLDVAHKELKKSADVWFDYEIPRKKKNEDQWIIINVHVGNKSPLQLNNPFDTYGFIWKLLNVAFPNYIDDSATVICDQLSHKNSLEKCYKRFKRLGKEYEQGKKEKEDVIKLIKHILKNDFEIKY